MTIEKLLETPQSITPTEFGLDNTEKNIAFAHKLLSSKDKTPIKKIDDGYTTLYKSGYKYFVIDQSVIDEPKIIYFMKFKLMFHKFLNRKCASQITVWREYGPKSEGIAKDIFFNNLLQDYQTIITDFMQTSDGQRFWGNRIADAFSMNFSVYFINFMQTREIKK